MNVVAFQKDNNGYIYETEETACFRQAGSHQKSPQSLQSVSSSPPGS